GRPPVFLFTENESNLRKLFEVPNVSPFVKDAFHEYVVHGRTEAVNPKTKGTKAAAHYPLAIPSGGMATIRLRLFMEQEAPAQPSGADFDQVFVDRIHEADAFYQSLMQPGVSEDDARISRQAHAGLLWSKQFYHYVVRDWLEGDSNEPRPPQSRKEGRNSDWTHLYNRDVISMPDKWEYPWYAAWDLAFHMIPL